ncbi:MAG TPA: cysteine--tRNA ligase [Myxococcales bacterium]|nr:cysteine--tRNA ligase [Myxococcales bacterium]
MPAPFRLYNTLSRKVEDFEPVREGHVGIYVCGMTVYDHIHVGHARAMVVFDSFVRYLRYRGWDVTFVRNFTDVDDKIIKRANELNTDPVALAAEYIEHFQHDVAALGLAAPDREPKVSESIGEIQAMTQRLIDKGHAYVDEGTVWYDVASFENYGCLSGQKVEELRSPDEVPGKRSPADFALWKAAKPGDPTWESPWGPGRPGWHIECSAMSCSEVGETIDIHGGGLDLVFPHHENEIAQSEAANGCNYVRYWMHNGLLTMSSGKKMGKSLGNVINVRDALKDFPAESLRLYYLQNLYRSPLPWGPEALPDALGMLGRLYEARENAEAMSGQEPVQQVIDSLGEDAARVWEMGQGYIERLHRGLDTDFNTAKVLGHLFELARAVNRFANHKKAKKRGGPVVAPALEAFTEVTKALGLMAMSSQEFMEEVKDKRLGAFGVSREQVEGLLAERVAARTAKDWARADAIRDELDQLHIVVMDRPDGSDWKVRLVDGA